MQHINVTLLADVLFLFKFSNVGLVPTHNEHIFTKFSHSHGEIFFSSFKLHFATFFRTCTSIYILTIPKKDRLLWKYGDNFCISSLFLYFQVYVSALNVVLSCFPFVYLLLFLFLLDTESVIYDLLCISCCNSSSAVCVCGQQ